MSGIDSPPQRRFISDGQEMLTYDLSETCAVEEVGDEAIESDEPPKMPEQFYSDIDQFLTRQPPKLKISKVQGSGQPNKIGKALSLPVLQARKQDGEAPQKRTQSKIKDIIKGRTEQTRHINEALLQEAFAYTTKLLQEAVIEEAREQREQAQDRNKLEDAEYEHPRSAPPCLIQYGKTPKEAAVIASKPKKKSTAGGLVKKMRSQQQQSRQPRAFDEIIPGGGGGGGSFNLSGLPEAEANKNVLDFDALVSNFENGTNLQRLRAELQASKSAIARTTEYMKQLAQATLRGK